MCCMERCNFRVVCFRWAWTEHKSADIHWSGQWAGSGHRYSGWTCCGVLPTQISAAEQEGVSYL
jgi:hypothetical protein